MTVAAPFRKAARAVAPPFPVELEEAAAVDVAAPVGRGLAARALATAVD
jgi:hypothetical protein